jgi:hypothetical protein
VLTTGASVSDVIEIIVYDVFSVGNFYNRTDSDSRYALKEGGVVFNETSADVDFRVESDANTHALFLEGSTGNIGVGTSSPPSYGSTFTVLQANNTASGIVQANNSTNSLTTEIESEGTRGAVGTRTNHDFVIKTNQTEAMRVDANGHITQPLQPAFFAHANTSQSDLSTGGEVTVHFQTERFDQNGDYDTSTYTFTAPVTGKYQFNVNVRLNNLDTAAAYYIMYLVTSNKTYFSIISPSTFTGDVGYFNLNFGVVADMDASDTAKVRFLQSGGSAQTDVDGGPGNSPSNFSGYLVA